MPLTNHETKLFNKVTTTWPTKVDTFSMTEEYVCIVLLLLHIFNKTSTDASTFFNRVERKKGAEDSP